MNGRFLFFACVCLVAACDTVPGLYLVDASTTPDAGTVDATNGAADGPDAGMKPGADAAPDTTTEAGTPADAGGGADAGDGTDASGGTDASIPDDAGGTADASADAGTDACTSVSCPACPPSLGTCCPSGVPCEGENCAVDCTSSACLSCNGICCSKKNGKPMCHPGTSCP